MAVNQDAIGIRTGISEKAAARAREHKFFLTAAIMFPVIVIIGFSKNYYFRPFFPGMGPMYSDLVRVHAVIMTTWILLFATQAWLVSSKRVNLHMKLGMAGVGLAVLVVVSGYLVSIGAIAHQTAADRGGIPPLVFLVVPIADLVLFVVFFGGAIYLRKRSSAEHKRLMILSALNFLPPAIAISCARAVGPWAYLDLWCADRSNYCGAWLRHLAQSKSKQSVPGGFYPADSVLSGKDVDRRDGNVVVLRGVVDPVKSERRVAKI